MQKFEIPSFPWHGDNDLTLELPDDWEVSVVDFENRSTLTDGEIQEAFHSPIGSPTISELAKQNRAKEAVIIVEDISRPVPTERLIPYILDELREGGMDEDSVFIVMAIACHEEMTRPGLVKKLGKDIVGRIEIAPHDVEENLSYLGESSRGTPIYVNKFVYEAGLKIGVGGVIPHPAAAWGGGAKIILPGVTGFETTKFHHRNRKPGPHGGDPNNEHRLDTEEIARKVGLDVIVNAIINGRREITGLVVGDFVEAHRRGVELGRRAYRVDPPSDVDVVISNAYPLDAFLIQSGKGMWPFRTVNNGGTKILVSSCPEGVGYHRLNVRGRLSGLKGKPIDSSDFIMFSPILGPKEAYRIYPNSTLFNSWPELIEAVDKKHAATGYSSNGGVKAALYPHGALAVSDQ